MKESFEEQTQPGRNVGGDTRWEPVANQRKWEDERREALQTDF